MLAATESSFSICFFSSASRNAQAFSNATTACAQKPFGEFEFRLAERQARRTASERNEPERRRNGLQREHRFDAALHEQIAERTLRQIADERRGRHLGQRRPNRVKILELDTALTDDRRLPGLPGHHGKTAHRPMSGQRESENSRHFIRIDGGDHQRASEIQQRLQVLNLAIEQTVQTGRFRMRTRVDNGARPHADERAEFLFGSNPPRAASRDRAARPDASRPQSE